MKKIGFMIIGALGICLISGCTKDVQVTEMREEVVEQVEASQIPEKLEELPIETLQVTLEERREKISELMNSSLEGNVSIEERMDDKYMCAIDYETNHLVILDEVGKVVSDTYLISPVDEELNLSLYAWADEKEWVWLIHHRTYQVKDFVKIDLTTGEAVYFEQKYGFNGDFALEPNTGFLCFSDAPVLLDVDEREAFIVAEQEVTLKLVNVFEEEEAKVIEVGYSRQFRPEWIEPYMFEYNDPYLGIDEIEKIRYSFNQSYELLPNMTEPVVYETDQQYREKYEEILKVLKASEGQSQEVVTLYGYTMPIQAMCLWQEEGQWINEEGIIRCTLENKALRLHLLIDDRDNKDCELLADFFRLKYTETTVKRLMDEFINEKNSYIVFKDESYIRFSLTTGGFKIVSIGREGEKDR